MSGTELAENILFIAVSSILATFDIEKEIGLDGKPIPPNDDYYPDTVRALKESQCKITLRWKYAASLIEQATVHVGAPAY